MMRGKISPRLRLLACVPLIATWNQARAEPLRLRADAIAETQSPTGLVMLEGRDKSRPWLDAQGIVWAGANPDAAADIMVLSFRVREARGWGEARGGRFVFTTGAIRPIHIDGVSGLLRAPWGSTLELAAGVPVRPGFGARVYDFMAGGRAAQNLFSRATLGVSFVERLAQGEIAGEEAGGDVSVVATESFDVAARGAYDVLSRGLAEASGSAVARIDPIRLEIFSRYRSPGRLLPATSLFSVLGDFPSEMTGASILWKAAPRLDVFASGAAQVVGGDTGGRGSLRSVLRLDDRGDRSLGIELTRQDVSTAAWSGVRATSAQPIGRKLRLTTEVEIAVPDDSSRGFAWPWGLLALAWRSGDGWEAAAAVEAAATPEHRAEANGLLRLSYFADLR
jgi:hypothetical protein